MSTTPTETTAPDLTTSPDGSFRYSVERLAGSQVRVQVEVDAARLRAAADRQFERHNQQAKIPGFRPGKAPRPLYERHYGTQHLWNEGADDLIDETYREITQRERVDPLEGPQIEIRQLEPDRPLTYTATVTVRPDVTLGDYRAHGAKVEPTAPTAEDVERVIAGMREHHAELRPVDRPAEANDVLTVDIDVDLDGRSVTMARNGHLELGREYAVPGLAEGLVGIKAGEERILDLTFPQDADEDLRGKTGKFRVHASAVAEKVLAALDEGFAKTVGVADVAALQKAVRDELAHGAFHEARDAAAETAIRHAVDGSQVDVPDVLIEDELDHMVAELRARATERGGTWERFLLQAKKTEPEIRAEWRPAAERRARSLLVLDAIAKEEAVAVSSTELAQEVALTPLAQQDPKALRDPRVLAAMARSMRNRKVVDKLIGLETPDAEREVLRSLGSDLDPHAEAAEHAAAEAETAEDTASAGPSAPPAIILPDRPTGTAEGREAIRKLLEK